MSKQTNVALGSVKTDLRQNKYKVNLEPIDRNISIRSDLLDDGSRHQPSGRFHCF